ncbi:GNAT family N-acetyltransferase [Butyrivibrio sp. DSM 10294]|uniref:GNAT family N-acetyltransferase n=1 Tax=Butyrivibrio sp. DSM 10294 TaxID=2972457 RepID=UPI00234EDCBC|nr:GNAT family N-acetyltransferase [Butyrivibrio sp. DSM 10294]MDC7294723.1 GNAT family N-acetyltransferase [Butyrivibrio sp. DSM 10294]
MGAVVRSAAKADFEAVRRIMNQVQELHVEWRPDIYRLNENFFTEEMFEELFEGGRFYVADMDGAVVGVLGIDYRHIETPANVTRDVVFIDSMAVDSEYRGKGIGHLFFDKVRELKRERNADGIELQVNARNRAAYEMYRSCGFTEKSINMELL